MELKLFIKQTVQIQKSSGLPGYYAGANPQTLIFTQGTLPAARQWANYNQYIDITDKVSDLFKLKLTWSTAQPTGSNATTGENQSRKSVSGEIIFEDEAYHLLKRWLVDDVSGALNQVDVRIEHVGCGYYEDYRITKDELQWCEDSICVFRVNFVQQEEALNCIKRTMIYDNWQDWFPESGFGVVKLHPRFSYCNEERPNGKLIIIWTFNLFLLVIMGVVGIIFGTVGNSLIAVINVIIAIVNVFGAGLNYLNFIDPFAAFKSGEQMFLETAGCGREHPAPLIRDYISNVCLKCGVRVAADTAPIFFSNTITIQASDPNRPGGSVITANNPYVNACYLFAQSVRGVRRFRDMAFFTPSNPDTTQWWIPENKPLLTLDKFLDQLAPVFNAQWRLRTDNVQGQNIPTLYFQRKDWFKSAANQYVYDFSKNASDRLKIVQGICYEWNGKKTPAYVQGLYIPDAADTCGNEAMSQQNGVLSFGNIDDNPTFEGVQDKNTAFGAARFRLDGASTDYLMDAMQTVVNTSFITASLGQIIMFGVKGGFEKYADYALLLKDETCTLPKIIIWDGVSYNNAKALRPKTAGAYNGVFGIPKPTPNPAYNTLNWDDPKQHPPKTKVIGSALTLGSAPYGYYEVNDLLNLLTYSKPAMLVNYPMYFQPGFYDNLWDWFHWIDDPRLNPVLNQNWNVKIELCCPDLRRLQVFNDGSGVLLGEKVKLPELYYSDGQINEITVSYDTSDTYGQWIEIKGTR